MQKNENMSFPQTQEKHLDSGNNIFLTRKEILRSRILKLDEELRGIRSLRSDRPDLYGYFEKYLLDKLASLVIRYRRKYNENPLEAAL